MSCTRIEWTQGTLQGRLRVGDVLVFDMGVRATVLAMSDAGICAVQGSVLWSDLERKSFQIERPAEDR